MSQHSEKHILNSSNDILLADTSRFTPQKKASWENIFNNEKMAFENIKINDTTLIHSPPTHDLINGVVYWDCHNVADYDWDKFVNTCSILNNQQIDNKMISFVGRGTKTHANVLLSASNIKIRQVISELVLVFDKQNLKKGKGHIIKEWMLNNPNKKIVFIDDTLENLENVYKCLDEDLNNCKLVHFVAQPSTQDQSTPDYATRIDTYEELIQIIKNYFNLS